MNSYLVDTVLWMLQLSSHTHYTLLTESWFFFFLSSPRGQVLHGKWITSPAQQGLRNDLIQWTVVSLPCGQWLLDRGLRPSSGQWRKSCSSKRGSCVEASFAASGHSSVRRWHWEEPKVWRLQADEDGETSLMILVTMTLSPGTK